MSYADTANRARETLKKKGQLMRVRIYSDSGYDPATSTKTTPVQSDNNVYGIIFDFAFASSSQSNFGTMFKPGTEVQQGDKYALLANDVEPINGRTSVQANGIDYRVIGVGEINPAGTPVIYSVHLRK